MSHFKCIYEHWKGKIFTEMIEVQNSLGTEMVGFNLCMCIWLYSPYNRSIGYLDKNELSMWAIIVTYFMKLLLIIFTWNGICKERFLPLLFCKDSNTYLNYSGTKWVLSSKCMEGFFKWGLCKYINYTYNFTLLENTSWSLLKGNLKNNFLAYYRWLVFYNY